MLLSTERQATKYIVELPVEVAEKLFPAEDHDFSGNSLDKELERINAY